MAAAGKVEIEVVLRVPGMGIEQLAGTFDMDVVIGETAADFGDRLVDQLRDAFAEVSA